jgi:hypothetical protein
MSWRLKSSFRARQPAGTAPLFIAVAADDQTVGYEGSINLFGAWRKAGRSAELHVFQTPWVNRALAPSLPGIDVALGLLIV